MLYLTLIILRVIAKASLTKEAPNTISYNIYWILKVTFYQVYKPIILTGNTMINMTPRRIV